MTDAALTASVLIWTIAIAAGAGFVFARLARLATWGRAREGEEALTRKIDKWIAVPIVTIAVSLALWDMSEYWWDKIERQLMWETRMEWSTTRQQDHRDISEAVAKILPDDLEDAAEKLKRNAGFKELTTRTMSEMEKGRGPKRNSWTTIGVDRFTLQEFRTGWKTVGNPSKLAAAEEVRGENPEVRGFMRRIDGDWGMVVHDTLVYIYLRKSTDGHTEVLASREHTSGITK